jgi:plastocyanin
MIGLRRLSLYAASVGALLLTASTAAAAPREYVVVIDKMKFGPVAPTLHKGDAIVWVNRDIFRHTATAANHSFDVDLPPGAKVRMVLKGTGSIPFLCRYHPGMRGVLQVN